MIGPNGMGLLLDNTIKVSLILLVAVVATTLLRRRSAALRHWVLTTAIVCAAVTPALELVVPSWSLVARTSSSVRRGEPPTLSIDVTQTLPQERSDAVQRPHVGPIGLVGAGRLIGSIWVAGIGVSLCLLLVGLARLAWLASRSKRVLNGTWTELAGAISREYGLRRHVVLLQSDHPTLLVTWGFIRPKVILPASAREWTEDRVRVVLCHELAHVRRGDWMVQMMAEFLRSAYWFNPLLWTTRTRLRQESEQACDDAVLRHGVEGSAYATHLLDLARAFKNQRPMWSPASAIVHPSSLERRISAMLNARLNRTPIARSARIAAVIALLLITVPIAGFSAFAQTPSATFYGSLMDQVGRILPDATLVLSNVQTQAKYELRSDQTGRFEVGLPAGDYELGAQIPGFAYQQGTFTLGVGQNLHRDIALQVGSVQETITVTAESGLVERPRSTGRVNAASQPVFDRCSQSPVGGCIAQPTKIHDVKPRYPRSLRDNGTEGLVTFEGRIGTDGFVKDLRVFGTADPDLASAAAEAVRQWQFTPTRLDGIPIEVSIKVSVTFVR